MKDCQKEDREDVTREDEDRWCQKQVQVLNAIFRPVGKIILSLSRRQSTSRSAGGGGLQDSETSCKDVQKPVQVFLFSVQYKFYVKHDYYIGDHLPSSRGPRPPENQCSTSPPPNQVWKRILTYSFANVF